MLLGQFFSFTIVSRHTCVLLSHMIFTRFFYFHAFIPSCSFLFFHICFISSRSSPHTHNTCIFFLPQIFSFSFAILNFFMIFIASFFQIWFSSTVHFLSHLFHVFTWLHGQETHLCVWSHINHIITHGKKNKTYSILHMQCVCVSVCFSLKFKK